MEIYIWIIIALLAVNVIVSIYAISEPADHKVFVRRELVNVHGSLRATMQILNTINQTLEKGMRWGFPVKFPEKILHELIFIKGEISNLNYSYELNEIRNELRLLKDSISDINYSYDLGEIRTDLIKILNEIENLNA